MFDRKALPVLLLLLFFLMGSWLLQSDELHVEHELPEKMEAGGSVEVPIKVQKGDRTGFAKLELDIPEGLKIEALEKNGSSFTFEKGTAKFIWMSMPEGTEFAVRYRLVAESGIEGDRTIEGDFRFIRDNERKRMKLEGKRISVQKELADSTDPAKAEDSSAEEEEDTTEQGSTNAEREGAESGSEEEGSEQLTGDVPNPQKKVDYKVQICAGRDPVEEGHFERVYGYEGDYDIEHHEGWVKYTTGLFEVYEKARDRRVQFRKNYELPGPFVTAYNDGERITVQEALMITDQEWVQ